MESVLTVQHGAKTYVNMCGKHTVRIFNKETDDLVLEVPFSGVQARRAESSEMVSEDNGLQMFRTIYGKVEGLPEAQDDVVIIVSMAVRQALPDRKDLASPGALRKDESGQPTGCYGLNFN
jgi:hypothetical protein